jgi:hypothetical protein
LVPRQASWVFHPQAHIRADELGFCAKPSEFILQRLACFIIAARDNNPAAFLSEGDGGRYGRCLSAHR